jgi:anti-anti-sigma factor
VKVEEKKQGDVLILYLSGRLDNPGSHDLTEAAKKVIESGERNLLIHVENLNYMNSSGLRVLLDVEKKCQAKEGKVAICSPKGMVRRVIELVGFSKLLPIYDSEEEALSHF